jgi:hypothetical protein
VHENQREPTPLLRRVVPLVAHALRMRIAAMTGVGGHGLRAVREYARAWEIPKVAFDVTVDALHPERRAHTNAIPGRAEDRSFLVARVKVLESCHLFVHAA